ncbi:autorepressor SdpR family transcription factor [Fibrella forsythiae]|uniref:Winged helix-turn-helix transcriptional regulator n=1 Tax=Fibrella forsythiae TaxID=2817061 RepID=A0ABS3JCX3_9BACT|nr:autorepressor SdpR family transcription factor [Fibrella forsythiae]MBO0947842.1 winged helix-turn-helix transcriptional regulator [Fibrella forsythiae]
MNALFKALNDPTRRQMLELLRKGDLTAGEIADQFEMTKPSISHHLDLLRQAGLVDSTKNGQFVTYTLNTTVLDELLAWLMNFTGSSLLNTSPPAPEPDSSKKSS